MAGSFLNTQYREVRPPRAEQLPDGRKRLTRFFSFKQNSEFPAEMGGTVATSTDAASNWSSPPTGWENLYLISAATDTSLSPNGSGNNPVTILTYESAGTIAQTDETKNGGALLIRTIRTAHTAPATPSGYTLIRQDDDNPSGFDTFTYTFAKGDGEISRSTEYRQSDDTGTTGVTVITIRHLTPSATGTDPTSSPGAGYVKTSEDKADQDGHRVWTVVYAKGTGLVVDEYTIRSLGKMYIYHRVALGGAPDAPTGNLDGAVTLFDVSVRKESGYEVYDYRWMEVDVDGQTALATTMRSDGSLVYVVTELNDTSDTPAYPGSGTAYLVDLDQRAQDGHYVNTATYIKPPATVTLTKMRQVRLPGDCEFETGVGGANLLIQSDSNRFLKCDVEISYATTQLTDTPWTLNYGTTYRASYTRTGQTVAEYEQKVLGFYVASSDTVSGTNENYNGVACSSYSATLTASSPTSLPTGATVLDVDHEVYLTAIDGTVVYRRTKVSHTF